MSALSAALTYELAARQEVALKSVPAYFFVISSVRPIEKYDYETHVYESDLINVVDDLADVLMTPGEYYREGYVAYADTLDKAITLACMIAYSTNCILLVEAISY